MADVTPGRKSLSERYGVEQPSATLERVLREHVGNERAQQILDELREANMKYGRASRVERARVFVEVYRVERAPISKRTRNSIERAQKLLDNADEYIAKGSYND